MDGNIYGRRQQIVEEVIRIPATSFDVKENGGCSAHESHVGIKDGQTEKKSCACLRFDLIIELIIPYVIRGIPS